MASSSGPLSEELQCPICLDMFTDPVTTPCGHNFCKICLKECWNNSQDCNCPFCKETFNKRPDLKINRTLRDVVDHFKEKMCPTKPEVWCDACTGKNMKALKSCLNCGASFCKAHLEPHNVVATLKKHKLIDPVENLDDYICQKHERPLELFCRDDQTCVCLSCTEGDHRTHNTVTLEQERAERKAQLTNKQTDVKQMIQDRMKKIQELKMSAEVNKKNTEKEKASSVEFFSALIRSIERCQAELFEILEEKQKAAEKQTEDLIKELEQEITELQKRDSELQQISHTEDHLQLLQIDPSLCSPLLEHTKNWTEISINTRLNVGTLSRALTQLKDTLDEKLIQTDLRRLGQYAVDVTLDPDSAHPRLILSNDGKQVRFGDIRHDVQDIPKRFNQWLSVLGKEGFSSGRFYYEVSMKGKIEWYLGVARESINRKGVIIQNPENGQWTVCLNDQNEFKALDSPPVSLSLRVKPQKVGVFVDYEEGLVSFYDVESSSHIYSYTGQSFTEKLYPYFSPCDNSEGDNSAPLIISTVNNFF